MEIHRRLEEQRLLQETEDLLTYVPDLLLLGVFPATQNLILNSEVFDNAAWSKESVLWMNKSDYDDIIAWSKEDQVYGQQSKK